MGQVGFPYSSSSGQLAVSPTCQLSGPRWHCAAALYCSTGLERRRDFNPKRNSPYDGLPFAVLSVGENVL